jgi:hypothetical protein
MNKRIPAFIVLLAPSLPHAVAAADIPAKCDSNSPSLVRRPGFNAGEFEQPGDKDCYRARNMKKGQDFAFSAGTTDTFGTLNLRGPGGSTLKGIDINEDAIQGIEFRAKRTGTHFVEVINEGSPGSYVVLFALDCRAALNTSCSLGVGQSRQGEATYAFDVDFYRTQLTAGKQYTFAISDADEPFQLHLLDSQGNQIAESPTEDTPQLQFQPQTSGKYFIKVRYDEFARRTYRLSLVQG